jgi:hypothetical protein
MSELRTRPGSAISAASKPTHRTSQPTPRKNVLNQAHRFKHHVPNNRHRERRGIAAAIRRRRWSESGKRRRCRNNKEDVDPVNASDYDTDDYDCTEASND